MEGLGSASWEVFEMSLCVTVSSLLVVPVSPRDSHEILPTIGGGSEVADFCRGFTKGKFTIVSYVFI